jgi:hypothetical protein
MFEDVSVSSDEIKAKIAILLEHVPQAMTLGDLVALGSAHLLLGVHLLKQAGGNNPGIQTLCARFLMEEDADSPEANDG